MPRDLQRKRKNPALRGQIYPSWCSELTGKRSGYPRVKLESKGTAKERQPQGRASTAQTGTAPNRELIQESGRDFKTNEEVKEETEVNAAEISKSCRWSG